MIRLGLRLVILLGLELALGFCLGRGITNLVSVSVRVRIQFTVRIAFGLGIRDRLSVRVSFMV